MAHELALTLSAVENKTMMFVLVVQLFVKTPALAQLAFVGLGWAAVRGFRAAR